MRVTLAAVADDRDLLGLDEIDVGITIVINAHGFLCSSRSVLCGYGGAADAARLAGTGPNRGRR
jgi:hypothetical protein